MASFEVAIDWAAISVNENRFGAMSWLTYGFRPGMIFVRAFERAPVALEEHLW